MKLERWRHLYLYAKYHYERTDIVDDLKTIIAKECLLDKSGVSSAGVVSVLADAAWKHINTEREFKELMERISPDSMEMRCRRLLQDGTPYDYYTATINALLGVLSMVKVYSNDEMLINLGEPDFTLLPESKSSKDFRRREASKEES